MKNPGRALDIIANVATAAASTNPKNVFLTVPEVINFYRTGSNLSLGIFIYIILFERNKKPVDYTHRHQ